MQGISQVRPIDPLLTNFGVEFMQTEEAFVANDIAPIVPVAGDTGTYYVWEARNNFGVETTNWSQSGGAPRTEIRATKDTFGCIKYGLEIAITDDDRRNSLDPASLDRRAINRITRGMMLDRELRFATAIQASPDTTLAGTARWFSTAADPRGNADTAKQTILKACGVVPNTLLLAADTFFDLVKNTTATSAGTIIKNAIQYVMATTANNLNPSLIAQFFDIERVIVGWAVYEAKSAAAGAGNVSLEPLTIGTNNVAGTYMWTNIAAFIYVDPNPSNDCLEYYTTFASVPFVADRYREEKTESDVLRVKQVLVEKKVCAKAAYVIAGTIA